MMVTFAVAMLAVDGGGVSTAFLRERLGFTAVDFDRLRAGEPVGKVLLARAPGEIALGRAIRLRVSREAYLRWYRDPRNWTMRFDENRPAILEAWMLLTEPTETDFAGLCLEPRDRAAAPGAALVIARSRLMRLVFRSSRFDDLRDEQQTHRQISRTRGQ